MLLSFSTKGAGDVLMNKVEVIGFQKKYNVQPILKDVSFIAKKGDILALLGDSGAGKSTLLRCLNLLEVPDEGILKLDEWELVFSAGTHHLSRHLLSELRRKVGMVFQQFCLWAHMTVLQNLIEAPLSVVKMNKKEAIEKARFLLNEVGILTKEQVYPGQLSGGQKQRVAIARALMMEPEVMLFDEPTSSLDPKMVLAMVNLIQTLSQKGIIVIIASHEMKFVKEVSNKTIFLSNGVIIEQGNTQHLFKSPKTFAFQEFIQSEESLP